MNEEEKKERLTTRKEMSAGWLLICWNEWCGEEGGGGLMGEKNLALLILRSCPPITQMCWAIQFTWHIWRIIQSLSCYLSPEDIPEACGDQEVGWVHVSSNVAHCGQRVGHLNNTQVFIYCNVFWFDKISKTSWKAKFIKFQKINLVRRSW